MFVIIYLCLTSACIWINSISFILDHAKSCEPVELEWSLTDIEFGVYYEIIECGQDGEEKKVTRIDFFDD